MVTQLPADKLARLRRWRMFVAVMIGITVAGAIWPEVALFALGINAFIWIFFWADFSGQIREASLVDHERLHNNKEAG